MREIEFRGKRKLDGAWIYGGYMKTQRTNKVQVGGTSKFCTVIPETLGEYTGRKDKNNQKIYEGDLLYLRNSNHDEEDGVMEVIFEDGGFMLRGDILVELSEIYSWELELVGNVYDNLELLEVLDD